MGGMHGWVGDQMHAGWLYMASARLNFEARANSKHTCNKGACGSDWLGLTLWKTDNAIICVHS